MKVLIVHRYFWPDTPNCGKILSSISDHLVQSGCMVDVITGQPSYSAESAQLTPQSNECLGGLKVKRLRLRTETQAPLWRIFNALHIVFFTFFQAWVKRYDVIIGTTIPPVLGGFSCALASKMTGARFIYYCMDIHPEIGCLSGDFSNRVVFKVLQSLDNWSCNQANPVLVHSDDMLKTMRARPTGTKFRMDIMNNFALPDESFKNSASVSSNFIKVRGLKLLFAGNLGRFQNLGQLMEAMSLVRDRQDIELVVMGGGVMKNKLMLFQSQTSSNVKFVGHQSLETVNQAILDSDACLVTLAKGLYKYAYPSKTMSYLKQGRPIIATVEPESEYARAMIEEGYGYAVQQGDPRSLADLFLRLADDASWRKPMRVAAKDAFSRRFSSPVVLARWLTLLNAR